MSWRSLRLSLLAVVLAMMAAPTAAAAEDEPPSIRVLSYNIHHGRGMDGVFDYDRLAKIINDLKPDLVALQEVDNGVARSGRVDQAAILAKLTGMHHAFGNALYHQGGEYGEAILSRYPIQRVRAHHLPFHPGLEPRTALAVTVQPDGGLPELVFVGTHLCHQQSDTRAEQTTRLNTLFTQIETPVLMAGDFNARPNSEPMKVLLEDNWVDAIAPNSRIDYILYRKQDPWHVAEVTILDEPVASDHDPVLAVLEWRGDVPDKADSPINPPKSPAYSNSFNGESNGSSDGVGGVGRSHEQARGAQPRVLDDVDPQLFSYDQSFTVQFWVRTTAARDERFALLRQKDFPDNSLASQKNAGWVFAVSDGTLAWNIGSGNRRVSYERDNGEFRPLNDGRWHQLTMTHDSDTGLVHLYSDATNVAIYNLRDENGFEFANASPLTIGGSAASPAPTHQILPAIAHGADTLQQLIDQFNAFGLLRVTTDELMTLISSPDELLANKRATLDPSSDADLLRSTESATLDEVKQTSRRLMQNPYTVHQAPTFMEVAPLLHLYRIVDGRITINHENAARYAARERLTRPPFDLDELTVWDRVLTMDEIEAEYTAKGYEEKTNGQKPIAELTTGVWNIFHGGIHHNLHDHGWDSRDAIVDMIRRENIDVVMMQETYSNGDYIAAELGYFFATTIDWDYLNQGSNISVLSRYPIEDVQVPPGSAFMNVAAKVRLSPGQHVWVMSNWYGMRNFDDVYDFHEDRFAASDDIPILFAGDFNAVPHTDGGNSPASRRLLDAGFTDAYRLSYPDHESHPGFTHRSGSRIDQLYFKGAALRHKSTEVLSQSEPAFPSDHYLIKSVFELRER